jgi:hypothetical protein
MGDGLTVAWQGSRTETAQRDITTFFFLQARKTSEGLVYIKRPRLRFGLARTAIVQEMSLSSVVG